MALGIAYVAMRVLEKSWNPKMLVLIVGVAAMTPDLIDKPTGPLYGYEFGGRLFAHTIVFATAVTVVSSVLWKTWSRKGSTLSLWPLLFSLGVWVHLLLDLSPEGVETLLWPAYGLGFPPGELSWAHLTESPVAIAGEVFGAIILVYLAVLIFKGRFSSHGLSENNEE